MFCVRIWRLSVHGQVNIAGVLHPPSTEGGVSFSQASAFVSFCVLWWQVGGEPLLPVFADALEGADEKTARTAGGIEEAKFLCAAKAFTPSVFIFSRDSSSNLPTVCSTMYSTM